MAMLWNAHMDKRTKIIVMGILSMGTISGVAVLIRVPYIKTFKDSDFLYEAIDLAVWSEVEPGYFPLPYFRKVSKLTRYPYQESVSQQDP